MTILSRSHHISDKSSFSFKQGLKVRRLPGFGTQCLDFIFLDELTASELLYLTVQITDVSHGDTHKEGCLHTVAAHCEHTPGRQKRHTPFQRGAVPHQCLCGPKLRSKCRSERMSASELGRKIRFKKQMWSAEFINFKIQKNTQGKLSMEFVFS